MIFIGITLQWELKSEFKSNSSRCSYLNNRFMKWLRLRLRLKPCQTTSQETASVKKPRGVKAVFLLGGRSRKNITLLALQFTNSTQIVIYTWASFAKYFQSLALTEKLLYNQSWSQRPAKLALKFVKEKYFAIIVLWLSWPVLPPWLLHSTVLFFIGPHFFWATFIGPHGG